MPDSIDGIRRGQNDAAGLGCLQPHEFHVLVYEFRCPFRTVGIHYDKLVGDRRRLTLTERWQRWQLLHPG